MTKEKCEICGSEDDVERVGTNHEQLDACADCRSSDSPEEAYGRFADPV